MKLSFLTLIGAAILAAQPAAPPATPSPNPGAPAPTAAPAKSPATKGQITTRVDATAPSYKTLKFGPPPPLKLPDIPSYTMPNGMKVFLLENHELPLINGFVLIRTGNLFDPKDKIGLAELTGTVMRSGGTKSKTSEQLDEQLENIAASVETGIGETNGRVGFNALKENVDEVLAVFQDVLMNPEFRQDKLALAKSQVRSAISRRNDDPGDIMSRSFAEIVYGRDNPYGWRLEYEHIDRIQRDDLIAFYRRYFFPANMIMAVQGDFSTADMRAKLDKLFGGWNYKQETVPPFPAVTAKAAPGVYFAPKQDVTQTSFSLGHLGGVLKDPNLPALSVMSDILGGGFSSRLFKEVRTRMGLAYSVSGGWGANYGHPGLFQISGSTKSQSTVDAIQASLAEVNKIKTTPVTDQELDTAKQSVLNSFVFNFDSPSKTLNRLITYEYYGYPKDFIFQYQKGVEAVTKEDVLRVAKEYLKPENIAIVAVGKASDFGKPLSTLGTVKEIDLSIPDAAKPAAPTDNASLTRGKALLQKAQQAAGGADKIAAVKDFTQKVDVTINTPQGEMKASQTNQWMQSGPYRQLQELPFGKVIVFYDGKTSWIVGPQGAMDMPPPVLRQMQGERQRVLLSLLLADRNPELTINAVGENTAEIAAKGGEGFRVDFDPATGLPARLHYTSAGPQGPTPVISHLNDWREESGIRLPHKIVVEQGGQKFAEATVTSWALNSGLSAEELSKQP